MLGEKKRFISRIKGVKRAYEYFPMVQDETDLTDACLTAGILTLVLDLPDT